MPSQVPIKTLRASALLDQQLWFLGHDIRHPDGNALVRFGFERIRSATAGGTTCYRLPSNEEADQEFICWGFAVYRGRTTGLTERVGNGLHDSLPAGVILSRHAASARLVRSVLRVPLHKPSDLPALDTPRTKIERAILCEGVESLARQLRSYEQWAQDSLGRAHRALAIASLPRHKRRRFADALHLTAHWQALAVHDAMSSNAPA